MLVVLISKTKVGELSHICKQTTGVIGNKKNSTLSPLKAESAISIKNAQMLKILNITLGSVTDVHGFVLHTIKKVPIKFKTN